MERYQDKSWKDSMRIRVDFNNMMTEAVADFGIDASEINELKDELAAAARSMQIRRPEMKWRELPYSQDMIIDDILATVREVSAWCENFVVLGIGGSALGPIAVQQALNHLHYNDLPKERRGGPRLYVEDNVDPERMAALLDVIDPTTTVFNVITKSGGTSETMSQLLIITAMLRERVGEEKLSRHLIATTDANKGNLIKIAHQLGLKTFYVPDGVGGRFSELCPVGLIAAAVCGIDVRELLAGAAYADENCITQDVWKNPAYMLATLQYIAMRKGYNISVMMPYADSLKYMADWYAQLWAESLGKRYDNQGREVHEGQTPVKSLGVTDQHSQVQLYAEGPYDKVVTFLGVDRYRADVAIPEGFLDIPDVSFLCGHSLTELIKAEQMATEYALMKSGHMNNTVTLPEVNAFTVGQLIYMLEVMTAFAGELLHINAFDQPGVEEGKNATYALLGKPGFVQKKAELDAIPQRQKRYII